ncbi:ornithine-acyl[acyl carrier protein] N-acyltransferase [Tistlia consotensis]|uniref:L-ornithine N(alpha)-acyltransferase n=1 Tax=Tistlia consotensis USBA 355 TaxID=560819 RepID=A0A1Y6CL03_9PROT|nr:GNAT family N-acyltransferase [Tistlia consotensis]SMF74417.1 ornithine-acyl[acyl carrier protein] N-acyltransferase [Tistlia consotensis USBA 355]SNS10575.1 ornithine-acyl[acyl carrier protein] N-acyltransferase [Tistlia consotensis]
MNDSGSDRARLAKARPGRPVDERLRGLHLRLAESEAEIEASQRLRYQVFVEEMGAEATPERVSTGREHDRFDAFCDHLLLFDTERDAVVGTYRFMRRLQADAAGGFYTATEYDIACLLAYPGEIMELGRSCVHPAYRTGIAMQLVWRGIAAYVAYHEITLLFGCASLHGTDPDELSVHLSYLYHHHLGPPALRPRALPERYTEMNRQPADSFDPRKAMQNLPPLIKGYLRLGGYIGEGAVVDKDFGTTDVCVIVKPDLVTEKYRRHLTRVRPGDAP